MGAPRFLVKNFFSRRIYPLHVLTPSAVAGAGEIVGNEMGRIGNACRDPLDFWTNETANTEVRGQVDCQVSRAADMLVIDRGHNLATEQVFLERSANGSSWTTVLDVTIPSASAPGTLTDTNGVVAKDGSWLRAFTSASDRYWRLRIPAMGAGLKPQVVNAWLDAAWAPANTFLDTPISPHRHQLGGDESSTQTGWLVRRNVWRRRKGRITIRLPLTTDYDLAVDQILDQFGINRPMWIVHDDALGHHAALGVPVLGDVEIEQRGQGWFMPKVFIDWVEHEPKEAA